MHQHYLIFYFSLCLFSLYAQQFTKKISFIAIVIEDHLYRLITIIPGLLQEIEILKAILF